ncbi:hypothetical protein [Phocaeicola plebeius]|uniref:hypothetical protein n=1 Tax=Phocaeicola plebeius TaxID=310297 RepID=UPI0026F17EC8|nr:hypothetical protein [Phocaeicola plebeius]
MKTFKLLAISLLIITLNTGFYSCTSQDSDSIIGTWKEYRDNSDDYLLSTWKFNEDGSGLYTVQGMTNTQKISFTWENTNSSTITINMNGEYSTLELNNGLLIENSAFGSVVYKKQ